MSTSLSDAFIQKVIDASDIVEIVGKHTTLSQRSGRYTGLCPFHNEKTPSFTVNEGKKLYYCFGCGAGGNVITFVMEMNKMPFPEAVEYLASLANIPLEREKREDTEALRLRKAIYDMNRDAANFYYKALKQSQQGKAYLESRGVGEDCSKAFALGFAPGRRALVSYLASKGYTKKDMLAASLARSGPDGQLNDFFYNRIIFPIQDSNGKLVGFGARAIDSAIPKYLNSSDNAVFQKRELLYNLNSAKKYLGKSDPLIIVEGYLDAISLADFGIPTAAASLGTALTSSHAKLIKRFSENVVLCYDSDAAGVKAALRGSGILMDAGLEPKVLLLEAGEDPDSFVRKHGKEQFMSLLAKARPAIDFEITQAAIGKDFEDINQRSEFVHYAASVAAKLGDEVRWGHYSQKISDIAGVDPELVARLIRSAWSGKPEPAQLEIPKAFAIEANEASQLWLLKYCAQSWQNFNRFVEAGGGESYFAGSCLECFKEICEIYKTKSDSIDIISTLMYNSRIAHIVSKLENLSSAEKRLAEQEMLASMKQLKIAQYEKELTSMENQIKAAESNEDTETVNSLLQKHILLSKELQLQKEVMQ